ncbi:MAG: regulatory protein ArsR [Gemmatimonadetes bacterium]|nr:regulatory protein ArsR [Gemmatimonadota bacterium]
MSQRTRSAAVKWRRQAPIFAALGDETRLALIAKLSQGDRHSIADLTEGTRLTRQGVTKHLRVLQKARLVRSVKHGRESLFELDPAPLREVRDYADVVSESWDRALARLRAFVEEDG